jgi:hypothetical protein
LGYIEGHLKTAFLFLALKKRKKKSKQLLLFPNAISFILWSEKGMTHQTIILANDEAVD